MKYDSMILKDLNFFVNGVGNAGRANECKLPVLKFKTIELDAGGVAGPVEVPTNVDKLELEFSTHDLDDKKMTLLGLALNQATGFTFRGAIKEGLTEIPLVAVCVGSIIEIGSDTKKGEKIVTTFKMSVNRYQLTVAGKQIYLIDKLNNIVMIGGNDLNALTRQYIGM